MALNDFSTVASSLGHAVRVSVPVSVTHNLEAMHQITANVLKELGCAGCHSGFDIRYDVLRDFVADARGNLRAAPGATAG